MQNSRFLCERRSFPLPPLLLPFVSSCRRQNRIRDRVVQCSVYNSGSLHQLLNLLLRKKEREREKKEGKTDSGKSIFLPASSVPVPAILILPARRPHHHVCTVVSVVPPLHHLSVCHSAALVPHPHPSRHPTDPSFLPTHSSMPHLLFLRARHLHKCFQIQGHESTQFHKYQHCR